MPVTYRDNLTNIGFKTLATQIGIYTKTIFFE